MYVINKRYLSDVPTELTGIVRNGWRLDAERIVLKRYDYCHGHGHVRLSD